MDCVIPHEFHGTNTEVTVAESSTERLRSRPSRPLRRYNSLKVLPVMIIEIYWSAVVRLQNIPVANVEPTTLMVRCAKLINRRVSAESIPLPAITPPKHIAQSTSHIVFIIPPIPLVATSSLSIASPVSKAVDEALAIVRALNTERAEPSPAINSIICGWKRYIATEAKSVATKSVINAGSLRRMSIAVSIGTMSNHGVMLKLWCNICVICSI